MRGPNRTLWLAGLGLAAVAAVWLVQRSPAPDIETRELGDEGSIGVPLRLLALLHPRPRLRLPRLRRPAE